MADQEQLPPARVIHQERRQQRASHIHCAHNDAPQHWRFQPRLCKHLQTAAMPFMQMREQHQNLAGCCKSALPEILRPERDCNGTAHPCKVHVIKCRYQHLNTSLLQDYSTVMQKGLCLLRTYIRRVEDHCVDARKLLHDGQRRRQNHYPPVLAQEESRPASLLRLPSLQEAT